MNRGAGGCRRDLVAPTLAAAFIAFVLMLAIGASTRSAVASGTYTANVCGDGNWLDWTKTLDGASHDWFLSGNCTNDGSTYSVDFEAPTESLTMDEEMVWIYPDTRGLIRTGLTISAADVIFSGSDGSGAGALQGIRFCGADCGDLITLSRPFVPESEYERRILSAGATALPADATELRFAARCTARPCGPTQKLKFLKLWLTFKDSERPTSGAATIGPDGQSPIALGWMGQPFEFRWNAEDPASGVHRVTIAREGASTPVSVPGLGAACFAFDYAGLCPQSRSAHQSINPTDAIWQEGLNRVFVDVQDRAGNRSQRPSVPHLGFYADRRNPTPTGLTVPDATPAGWVRDPEITLDWVNEGESGESKAQSDPHSGVVAVEYDFQPRDGGPDPAPRRIEGAAISSVTVTVPWPGAWNVVVRTIDAVGNRSAPMSKFVGFDAAGPPAPQIDPIGWVGSAQLLDGHPFAWIRPAPTPSGICGYGLSVDGSDDTDAPAEPSIDGDVARATLPNGSAEGPRHLHLRAISCAGVPGETAHRRFDVDLTPPVPRTNLADGVWIGRSSALRVIATDDRSGVRDVRLKIDGSTLVYPGAEAAPELPEGMRTIEYGASDAAGNVSSPESLTVGVDRSAPIGWFEPPSPERPTLISAIVTDAHSGIGTGAIDFRPAGGADGWTELATRTDTAAGGYAAARLTARFPDFSRPAGVYELRVRVTDAVGNATVIITRFDGAAAMMVTPVRERPKMTFAFEFGSSTRCAKNGRAGRCRPKLTIKRRTVGFGRGAMTAGRLVDAAGRPLPGRAVTLFAQRTATYGRTMLRTVETDANGRFRARVKRGVNRRVFARFQGSELLQPAEDAVLLFTRSKLTLKVNRRRVRPGGRLIFSGRLASGGEKIALGIPIYVRALGTRLSAEAKVGPDGRYRGLFPTGVRAPLGLALQAHVPEQDAWPYAAGDSRVVKVTIAP